MMKLKQIVRSLLRDRLNTFVILVSLAFGIAIINLIIFFLNRELNTDNFQKNVDRIYLLKCDDPFNKGSRMSQCRIGGAEYMKNNFAQVEDFCRINRISSQKVIANNQTYYDKPAVYETSDNFFTFFTYTLLTNNPNSVLETKTDIAISEELAKKYFGGVPPVGHIITLINGNKKTDYIIKGVFRKSKENTLLRFDMVKFSDETESYAFLLVKNKTDPSELEKLFAKEKEKIPSINDGTPGQYYLKSLKEAYFDTTENSPPGAIRDRSDLWIALIIGLMIMAVASFNYLGLINNKLMEKAHEFCLRRLNGASIVRIISGFMLENFIVVTIAFAFSLEIMSWIMPLFNELTGSDIDFSYLLQSYTLLIILGVILILLIITLLFSFSRIKNQTVSSALKNWVDNHGKIIHIPVFHISQLTVTLVMLVCAFVIIKQINYISKKDIGLDKEVIEIKLPVQYGDMTRVFKEEILGNPAVSKVSVTPASPLLEYWMVSCEYNENGIAKQYYPVIFHGDENFINTLGIKLIDGRNFSGILASDSNNCIINESMVKYFPDQNLMGKKLPGFDNQTVIGIFRDFNFISLKNAIAPGAIMFDNTGDHLLVKPSHGQLTAARQVIKETWQKLIPDYPLNIESVRERFEWYHRENSNYAKLIGSCCFISLFLSMIGLFAISYNSGRKRTKEIGIRKINGATIFEVITLLNKDFIRWVIIAFLIATPVAWWVMRKWLENYAYKTKLGWWIFAAAGVSAMVVALLTISWQSWRVATSNPVEALRYE